MNAMLERAWLWWCGVVWFGLVWSDATVAVNQCVNESINQPMKSIDAQLCGRRCVHYCCDLRNLPLRGTGTRRDFLSLCARVCLCVLLSGQKQRTVATTTAAVAMAAAAAAAVAMARMSRTMAGESCGHTTERGNGSRLAAGNVALFS